MKSFLIFAILLFTGVSTLKAQLSDNYSKQWDDPEIVDRIQSGIEQNRKGYATLIFTNEQGVPVVPDQINIKQTSHDFMFGANLFMVDGFDTKEKNDKWESAFKNIFNFGTIPFYWKDLEPEQGHVRFRKDSEKIYRRPAPDLVLEFCEKNGITPKGHPLIWDNPEFGIPDWFPNDKKKQEELMTTRLEQIAKRYDKTIKYWDVVNELTARKPDVPMFKDYAFKAFKLSEKLFSPGQTFLINDVTRVWQMDKGEYSHYYQIIENLLLRGAKIDAIGLQFHFFSEERLEDVKEGIDFTPKQLFRVLDSYSDFGKPLHITEITIPTLPYNKEGLKTQAILTENFYRLWFSHPYVENIIWWNLADNTAVKGEDKWNAGLIDKNLKPKPSYEVLDRLINKEWKTSIEEKHINSNSFKFKGFYGKYSILVKKDGKTYKSEIHLIKESPREFAIVLE